MEDDSEDAADPEGVKGPAAQDWPDDKMPSDYEAQCYLERYHDLGHIIGGFDLTKAKMHWMEHGRFEGRWMTPCGLSVKSNPMSLEEDRCYKDRYTMNKMIQKRPLKMMPKLYDKWGRGAGFNRFCAPRITFWQSYCMLAKSPDLQSMFGKFMDKVDMTDFRLMRYWQQYGYFEGRDPSCSEFGGELFKCAKAGEDCKCPYGQVYFGRAIKKGVTLTPSQMLQESHQYIDTRFEKDPTAPIKCDKKMLKINPQSNLLGPKHTNNAKKLGCWCQSIPKKLMQPVKCADEGGVCSCPSGNVFFGVGQGEFAKRSEAFSTLTDSPYAVK
jgi:hypothetical protein